MKRHNTQLVLLNNFKMQEDRPVLTQSDYHSKQLITVKTLVRIKTVIPSHTVQTVRNVLVGENKQKDLPTDNTAHVLLVTTSSSECAASRVDITSVVYHCY